MAAGVRRTRIVIFAKAPVPGQVKTRLIPALGPDGAADLARKMLRRTYREAKAVPVSEVELCVDPEPSSDAWQRWLPRGAEIVHAQGDGDLGERLGRAAERVIGGGQPIVLIGTDCPALSTYRLKQACLELESHDAVIFPTFDGGYALLGLNRFDPSLFSGIAWSTETVASTTIARIRALGWSVHLGETLRDVDEPEDLAYLPDGF